jgi:hypothetical protein
VPDFEIEINGEPGSYRVAARSEDGETGEVPVRFSFDDPRRCPITVIRGIQLTGLG